MNVTEKTYYTIGEVSEKCNIPIKTLRYYDEIKLIVPYYRNETSNYRYYTKEQMITIFIIRKLKALGFSLKEIKSIVSENKAKKVERNVQEKLSEISNKITALQRQYMQGQNLLKRLKRGVNILDFYDSSIVDACHQEIELVKIEDIPERNLFFIRRIMKNYDNADVSLERWIEIIEEAEHKNLKISGPIILTYYENLLDQFLRKDCDVEFAIEVNEYRNEPGFRKFGGFKAAIAMCVGDYSKIVNTYIKIIQWVNQNKDKYRISGYPSDEFIISPVDLKNEHEHITKVIIPIEEVNQKQIKNQKIDDRPY